jgi:hypothetical protein
VDIFGVCTFENIFFLLAWCITFKLNSCGFTRKKVVSMVGLSRSIRMHHTDHFVILVLFRVKLSRDRFTCCRVFDSFFAVVHPPSSPRLVLSSTTPHLLSHRAPTSTFFGSNRQLLHLWMVIRVRVSGTHRISRPMWMDTDMIFYLWVRPILNPTQTKSGMGAGTQN